MTMPDPAAAQEGVPTPPEGLPPKTPDESPPPPADQTGGTEKSQDDEPADAKAAQERATDRDNARRWQSFGAQIGAGMDSLVGAGANLGGSTYVFYGDTSVGHIGDRHGTARSSHLGMVVRSGPVPAGVLDRIRKSYVEPAGYLDMHAILQQRQFVFIRARNGTGRTTTALRLLDQLCGAGVRKLDPDITLKSLDPGALQDDHGYLLESLAPEQARELRPFHIDRLSQVMRDKGCMLVVIVDESTPLDVRGIGEFVIDDLGVVDPESLVRRHVEWGLRELAEAAAQSDILSRPEVREIVAELTHDIPRRELAELGALLVDVATEQVGLDVVRERYSRASEANFVEWFNLQTDVEQRAFVIALAVFNNESVQLVSEAATLLADRIKAVEIPRRMDRARRLFVTPLQERLANARAELHDTIEETQFGAVAVTNVRFRDDRFPRRILEHLCTQYDQAFDIVRGWLFDLGVVGREQVRIRAGIAAGLLSLYDFIGTFNKIILPWAGVGNEESTWAAVAALQIPGQQPDLSRVVYRILDDWIRSRSEMAPELRATALQALGNTEAMSIAAALRLMRLGARRADERSAVIIGQSITDLFCRTENPGQVLTALVRWSSDTEPPARRNSALVAVLTISAHVVVTVTGSSEKWPALVALADTEQDLHDPIITLFGRLLQAQWFTQSGYAEVLRWIRLCRTDKALREPVARLLIAAGKQTGDLTSIRYYLRYWADERKGFSEAATAVLAHFDEGAL